ncbi:hypothetical protein MINTM005_31360 [Mycobacterium intracellulare]|nr:hypothetical protein A5769_15100 [Mycobacterium intracellulare]BCO57892.1 hypothetical protein MINTM005_31360 [Mycobacterium intracellulare]BCO95059.1 hypothetical protein MINTM016_30350 [Mycobacterium intracellulare]
MARRRPRAHHDDEDQDVSTPPDCAPDGQHCAGCNGTHNPRPGVAFETARTWGDDEDRDDEQD